MTDLDTETEIIRDVLGSQLAWFASTSWIASEPSDKIIPAFVKALWEMDDVAKTKNVVAGPMRYSYADLGDVFAEIRPKLKVQGLALSQTASTDHGVTTTLFHESGQWIRFAPLMIRPAGATPQNVGSAITYAKRYSAQSVMGIATEDDDGRAAAVAATPTPAAHDPRAPRVDAVLVRLEALSDDDKVEVKAWAEGEGKRLSGKALYEDPDWLDNVEAYLDVLTTEVEPDPDDPGYT
jgi:hypothetical protein